MREDQCVPGHMRDLAPYGPPHPFPVRVLVVEIELSFGEPFHFCFCPGQEMGKTRHRPDHGVVRHFYDVRVDQ